MDDRSIRAQRLTHRYGEQLAVDHVDLDIPSAEIFAFLGPNGAGKTTVVKMLTTILSVSDGSATVAGLDVVRQSREVRMRIGVALQDVGVDPLMTAREMLILQARLFGESGQ
jgi:ABC-2 type transport system ATP-binding protein